MTKPYISLLLFYMNFAKKSNYIILFLLSLMMLYTGCSAKMYPIFVLFISPVKIEIFQVCLFHFIGNFVFHPIFFS